MMPRKARPKTRYEQMKKLDIQDMVAYFSWHFGCDRCPAKRDNCSDNDAMCMDAIAAYLNSEGKLD